MNVELPDSLAERAAAETAERFGGDFAALAAAAVDSYLTMQEMLLRMASPPPVVDAKPGVSIDPTLLLQHLGAGPIDPADLISGKQALPEDALQKLTAIGLPTDLSKLLEQGAVPPETAAKLPADVILTEINPAAIQRARAGEADEIEQVAQVVAHSDMGSEELAKLARAVKGVADRVAEIRRGTA